jgi:UDP-glucose 4-epimerase
LYDYLGQGELFSVRECITAFKNANDCDFEVIVKPRRPGDPGKIELKPVSPYTPILLKTLEEMMKV